MKKNLSKASRIALFLCGLGLIVVLFVPLWKIDLVAPQYPEGLMLIINPDGLAGNVDIINGLNHYIGMKVLRNEDFFEFKILPYIIGFFALMFLLVAWLGKRKWLTALFVAYVAFGVVAMYDFWRWEYEYGHDLDPNAAIKVPGMAYQPPLIGYKQLLNFSAYSLPATGGWIFIGVGAVSLALVVVEFRRARKDRVAGRPAAAMASLFLLTTLQACSAEAEPIKFGIDNCHACKMTISDQRYGAEIVTKKGRAYKFDDTYCVVEHLKSKAIAADQVEKVYLVDFNGGGKLIDASSAVLYKTDELRSPMGGNVAAFSSREAMQKVAKQYKGNETSWKEISSR